jgi:hypothetical protein
MKPMRTRRQCLGLALVGLSHAVCSGCGPTQIAQENRKLLESLATAVSARNVDWLARNQRLIDERHERGRITDSEFKALQRVTAIAATGDWKQAEREVLWLRDGQRPGAAHRRPDDEPFPLRKPNRVPTTDTRRG